MSTQQTSGGVRTEIVQESEATGEVAQLYEDLRELFSGFVPDVFKLVSTRPDMLAVFVGGYQSMFAGGHLPRDVKEMIATTVARVASCQYCTSAHDTLLRLLGTEEPQVADAVVEGRLDDPSIPANVCVLLQLASDISEHAHRVGDEDFERVLGHGWTDAQILEAVWTACLFNSIVRLADTLGLHIVGQLEERGASASASGV